jgi:hypothetical protein
MKQPTMIAVRGNVIAVVLDTFMTISWEDVNLSLLDVRVVTGHQVGVYHRGGDVRVSQPCGHLD